MLILGLIFSNHDSAACLVADGQVIAASAEERHDRIKHSAAFPINAIEHCIRKAGISYNDLDRVSLYTDPRLYHKLLYYNLISDFPRSLRYLPYPFMVAKREYGLKSKLRQQMPQFTKPVTWVTHHMAHAASAFYPSPFESAAIMTLDGRGEYETGCIFLGQGTTIRKLHSLKYPHSLGYLYGMVTKFCGFRPFADEYKLMGLSAYGNNTLCDAFSDVARVDESGTIHLNLKYFDHTYTYGVRRNGFSRDFVDTFGPPRTPNEPVTERVANLAFALQRFTEQAFVSYARLAKSLTGETRLCIAGGVALNCLAVARLLEEGLYDKIFVQPASDDAGTSLGSALHCSYSLGGHERRDEMKDVFFGPSFPSEDIRKVLNNINGQCDVTFVDDPCIIAAQLIHDQRVIGWFQGGMEFGPRALGNRSIIASPVDATMKDTINATIKFREEFRPFAPAVLREKADDFFHLYGAGELMYSFMLATARVRSERAADIPAVVHIDGTARVQTVAKTTNPMFWRLISEYEKLSGIPVVLNTSYNVRGEPIVCSPEHAIDGILNSDLEYAIIGNYLVHRRS